MPEIATSSSAPSDSALAAGSVFEGGYEIVDRIGGGSFSTVYRARQLSTGQEVAIKVLRSMRDASGDDGGSGTRFRREMQLSGELYHPHIVPLIDCGESADGRLYAVFQLVPGQTLRDLLDAEGRLAVDEACRLMIDVLDALSGAHEHGIVHRDLKPENIMVAHTGTRRRALVLDFGLGGFVRDVGEQARTPSAGWEIVGTPTYAAPEQLRGELPSTRSDLYSWGLIFLECLTGEIAIRGASPQDVLMRQLSPEPVPIAPTLADRRLRTLLETVTAKAVDKRSVSAEGLLEALGAFNVVATPAAPLEVERRQLTLVCCGLTIAAEPGRAPDLEALDELLHAQKAALTETAQREGGHIVGTLADRLIVAFGYPQADEHDARRAVRVAERLRDAATAAAERERAASGADLSVRIGVHTGLVVAREQRAGGVLGLREVSGLTPQTAVDLQARAAPGEILLSADTVALLRGERTCEPLPDGGAGAAAGFRLVGEPRIMPSSAESSFVGRVAERALLEQRWDAAQAGRGAALLVTGEPGIGKSRLVGEISRRLGRDVVLESRCAPAHRDSPLFPIVETLIGSGDSLPALFEQNGLDAAERLPALARVCALPIPPGLDAPRQSPEREKELALDTLVRGLVNMAARHPLLLVIEDLHWADPTTVEFAVQLVDELHSGAMSGTPPPWLVLFTARGEFVPPWPTDAVATVALDRLAPPESGELVRGAVGDGGVPAALVDVVVQRADGVPLFLEELAREVADARADNTDAGAAAVPASLRDLLAARLDRLSFGSRETAQMAAVLGREFRYELLRAVCGRHERVLRDELRELVRSGLMVTQRAARVETFAFKHALVRDAAYDGMLRAARMNVHCRAAAALRRRFPEVAAQQPEVVAQHHEAGGELDAAVDHWTLAGDRAAGRGAYREAIQAFEHALRLVEALPPSREGAVRELAALTSLGTALLSTQGYAAPAVEEAFIRAQRLCEALGADVPARVLHGIWGVPIVRSDHERAVRLLPAFNRLIQRSTDPVDLITGHAAPALFAFFRGNFERARDGFETASAWYRTKGYEEFLADYGYDGGLYTFGYLMWCESILGHPRRALELREEIYALAARHTTPYGNAIALGFAANVAYELRDAQTAFDITAGDIPVLTEQKIYLFLASAMATHGWALGALGEPEAGFANLSGGLALLQTIGCRALYPLRLTQAAEIHLRRAAVADALGAVDEGLGLSADLLDCMSVPELQRLKGECKRRAGQPVPAEAHFQAAIDLALEQGARTCALRAAVNLAELLAAANRRSPARAVLEPIYELFTDGVDTTDIVAARALLTALD